MSWVFYCLMWVVAFITASAAEDAAKEKLTLLFFWELGWFLFALYYVGTNQPWSV